MIDFIDPFPGESHPEEMIFQFTQGSDRLWVDFGLSDDGEWDVYVAVSCAWRDSEYPGSVIKTANSWFIRANDFPKLWERKFRPLWGERER